MQGEDDIIQKHVTKRYFFDPFILIIIIILFTENDKKK